MQLERGSPLGKYIIRERLGGGGMGVVYRARHAQLGRDFAIKTIHADKASDKDFALRFRREAEAIARIDHPNIVSVADFVEGDPAKGEISYIVMEYLRGKDLGRIIKEGGPMTSAASVPEPAPEPVPVPARAPEPKPFRVARPRMHAAKPPAGPRITTEPRY